MSEMNEECAEALRREFGYIPDTRSGEQWTVYKDHALIVTHPERLIRVYERNHGGVYHEIDPTPWR